MRLRVSALVGAFVLFMACFAVYAEEAAPTRTDLLKAQIATVQAQTQAARAVTSAGQLQAENGKLWEEKLQGQERTLQNALDSLTKKPDDGREKTPTEEK